MRSSIRGFIEFAGTLISGIGILIVSKAVDKFPITHELFRDIGIAVVVAAFVTIFIEYRRDLSTRRDAVDVIVGRIIPPPVWEDFRSNIIANQVICESWDLDIFVTTIPISPQFGAPAQPQYVATGTMIYKLNNLARRTKSVELRHELENDIRGFDSAGKELPRFVQVTVTPASGASQSWDEAALARFVDGEKVSIPVSLPPSPPGPVEIVVKRKEIIPIPGGFPWYMYWITRQCKISIRTNVDGVSFDLWPRHHDGERFRPILPGETWSFEGVMLPGQGFEIQCRK